MPRINSASIKNEQASRLKRLRDHMQLSQRDLAEEFKVAPSAVALWELGARSIPGPVLRLIELFEEECAFEEKSPAAQASGTIPTTRLGRTIAMSLTANDLALEWLKLTLMNVISSEKNASSLRARAYSRMAHKLAERLGNMKGLGTKTFQSLGYFDFLVPSTARQVFSQYKKLSSPMSQKKVAEIFVNDLGQTPKKIFAVWSAKPLATASIGQVHVAKLTSGERVAVKVQYPKIADAIRADLKNLATLEKLTSFFLKGQDKGVILREMALRFSDECDYLIEANHQEHFRQLFFGRPEVVIPRVHRNISSKRILVTDYIRGQSFKDFLYTSTQEQRNAAGKVIWKFAFESILNHGIFNADPHADNYLFQDGRVVFLDFGCVTTFDADFLQKFKRWLSALLRNDAVAHRELLIEFGIAPMNKAYDFYHHFEVARMVYRPMLANEPCVFSSQELTKAWRAYFVDSPNRALFNHSKEWVFQMRLNWGLTFMLASLGAKANWRRMLQSVIDESSKN